MQQIYQDDELSHDRYSDIRVFAHTRVRLDPKPWPNDDTTYINAAFIDVSYLLILLQ
jgi:protein tyrosine phosphatase